MNHPLPSPIRTADNYRRSNDPSDSMFASTHDNSTRPSRYGRLLRFAIPYWRGWTWLTVLTFVSSFVSLAQPWPMKVLVDNVLGTMPLPNGVASIVALLPGASTNSGLLMWVAAAGVAFFLLNSCFEFLLTVLWIRVGQGMVYDLAGNLFSLIQRRSLRFHSMNAVGDSLSRITGDSWCVNGLLDTLVLTPARATILLITMAIVMAQMNWQLTAVTLVVSPLMTISGFVLGRKVRDVGRAQREIESRIQSHVQQTLSGIQVVQAFAQERAEKNRFCQLTSAAIRASQRGILLSNLSGLGTGLVSTIGIGIVLLFGSRSVLQGSLTVGGLLVFLSYLGSLQIQIKTLVGVYTALQGIGGQVDRVNEILRSEPEVRDTPHAASVGEVRGEIRFECVTFGYEENCPVLREIELEAQPGQVVAIVGATGAGKSTLAALVPRLFDPWEGRVTLDGRDLRAIKLRELRETIAIVLQEPFLFPASIAANIAYGRPKANAAQIEAAARAANAHEFIEKLPLGYDTVLGERGVTLSGGQRQRLNIARALLKDAPVLVLDEPTSALDAQTERLLLEALDRLMAGRTTFVIAHRLTTIRHADLIVVLESGRIIERGTHEQLLATGGKYGEFCANQYGDHVDAAMK